VRLREPPHGAARRVVRRDARVRQPSWSRSYLVPGRRLGGNALADSLEVMAEILGGSDTSRLYRRLVLEEKAAVSAGAYYVGDAYDQTRFVIYARPAPGGSVERVEALALAELEALMRDGVGAEALARAKRRMRAAAIYARDSLQTGAQVLGTALTTGQTIADVETWPERIEALDAAAITDAARRVLRVPRSVTGILLPKDETG
ncbi:MAG: insulinase family protein, partial [Alphaproteobacteria bacterium]